MDDKFDENLGPRPEDDGNRETEPVSAAQLLEKLRGQIERAASQDDAASKAQDESGYVFKFTEPNADADSAPTRTDMDSAPSEPKGAPRANVPDDTPKKQPYASGIKLDKPQTMDSRRPVTGQYRTAPSDSALKPPAADVSPDVVEQLNQRNDTREYKQAAGKRAPQQNRPAHSDPTMNSSEDVRETNEFDQGIKPARRSAAQPQDASERGATDEFNKITGDRPAASASAPYEDEFADEAERPRERATAYSRKTKQPLTNTGSFKAAPSGAGQFDTDDDKKLEDVFNLFQETETEGGAEDDEDEFDDGSGDKNGFFSLLYNRIYSWGAPKREEYTSRDQNKEIFTAYQTQYSNSWKKMIAVGVMLVLMLYIEIAPYLSWWLPRFMKLGMYDKIYMLLDLQILVIAAALIIKNIIFGFMQLFRGKPDAHTITSMVLLVNVILWFVTFFTLRSDHTLHLYSTVAMLCIFCQCYYNHISLKKEILSFNIISSKKIKYALKPLGESVPEHDAFYQVIADESDMQRVVQTDFVDDFFARTGKLQRDDKILRILLPLSVLIAVVLLVVCYLMGRDVTMSIAAMALTIIAAMPASMYFMSMLPTYNASKSAFDLECALVGNAGLAEYKDISVVTIDDVEVFPSTSVKVSSVRVYGSNRIDEVIFDAACVFSRLGGPLRDVFSTSINDEQIKTKPVRFEEFDNGGFRARVNGKIIYIGSGEYIRQYGYEPTADDNGQDSVYIKGGGCIMYLTYEDQIAAKFYIKYGVDPLFEQLLRSLQHAGICVSVRTFDPNITNKLLSRNINTEKYSIKIIKNSDINEAPRTYKNISSGIISRSTIKNLLQSIVLCSKISQVQNINKILGVLSFAIGVLLVAVLVISNSMANITAGHLLLFQIFWLIPLALLSSIGTKN